LSLSTKNKAHSGVLLLNPPSARVVFRDHYHSQVGKATYHWHPNDLLIQSGFLMREFRVELLDSVAEKINYPESLRRALEIRPSFIFTLMGQVSEYEDAMFLVRLKERLPEVVLVAAGDILQFPKGNPFERYPFLDGILNYMVSPALGEFFRSGRASHVSVTGDTCSSVKPNDRTFDYPVPALDLFLHDRYTLPMYGGKPYHSITLSLGCPFRCHFCVVPRFPRQVRELDGVWEELEAVAAKGIRHLFIRDACFGYDRTHTREFCEGLIRRGLDFRFSIFTRTDFLDNETIALLRRAGCFMAHLGVESYDDDILASEEKRIRLEDMSDAFRRCRRAGLRTSALFVLGLDPDDARNGNRFIKTVRSLKPDYVSFNVFQSRPGLSAEAINRADLAAADPALADLQRKLTLRFYLSPGFALRQLKEFRSRRSVRDFFLAARSVLKSPEKAPRYNPEPAVSMVRCGSYSKTDLEDALDTLLAPFGGASALANPGETILIKPNLLRAALPEEAVTTHPEIVRACIRLVRRAGANPLVGDLPAIHEGAGRNTAATTSGIAQVCREEGNVWTNLAEDGFRELELLPGLRVKVAKKALQVDALLSIGKVKTHIYTGGTGALKNLFGCVAPSCRKRLHSSLNGKAFSRALAALVRVLPVRFAVLDGVIGMEGRGPGQGIPKHLGLVMGSPDAVALDRVAASVTGMDRRCQPVLDAAADMQLGENRLDKILIMGENLDDVHTPFRLPPPIPSPVAGAITRFHFRTFDVRPEIDAARCERCGACVEMCSVGAITLEPKPSVDGSKCLSCFCCHEVCPSGAVIERFGLMARLWRRLRASRRIRHS